MKLLQLNTLPNRYPQIEISIRSVFDFLRVKLLDLRGSSCCPAPGVFRSFHIPMWRCIAARNLTIAEELGVDMLTGCNGCYGTLRDAWIELKSDPRLKKMVNKCLIKVGRKFKGTFEPKHVVQALYLDMGLNYLRDFVKFQFKNLNVAVHYGCHIIKPSDRRPWGGKYEFPNFLDEIVELTGAKSIPYKNKYMCCGAGGAVRSAVKEVAADFTREKLMNMRDAKADIIIDCCPFCHLQLDSGQLEVNNFFKNIIGEPFNIPVIYITQLLGIVMGVNPKNLGLVKNQSITGVTPYISIEPFIELAKDQLV